MNIKPEELVVNNYELLDQLDHKELVPFIQTYMKKRTKYAIFYYVFNVILFGIVGFAFVYGIGEPDYSFGNLFTKFSYGLALAVCFIPLHEYIHVLAYKSQGAKNTSYDANIKKFYFMALADKFVANKKEFQIVALAPFIVINSSLIILIFILPSNWTFTLTGALLAHSAMCSGDFGLLSYFEFHKERQVVTYDDVKAKISYFYGKMG
jgi:hypothetical protein